MSKDNDVQKIDEDSCENLEQVRKGKPRKFVMICKGTSVISLVVYKKGSVDKYRKQAKEAGKGTIYTGLITGRGVDIRFQLAIEDGFDKEPVKPLVLKSFLEEEAEFKCKPEFEIVPSLGFSLDEDDPTVVQYRQLEQPVKAAAAADARAAGELMTTYAEIGQLLDQDQAADAQVKLKALQTRLAELKSAAAPTASASPTAAGPTDASTPPPAPPPPPTTDEAMTEFKRRLATLKPKIDAAVQSKSPAAEQLRKLTLDAAGLASKKQYDAANDLFDQVEKLLSTAAGPAPEAAPPPSPPETPAPKTPAGAESAEFDRLMEQVEPSYLEHIAKNIGDVSAMRVLFTYAQEQAEAGQHVKAVTALKRLKPMLEDVAIYRQSLAVWDSVKERVNKTVNAIAAEILEDFPEAAEEAGVIRELMNDFRRGLSKTLVEAVNAKDAPSRLAKHREAAAILTEYEGALNGNEVIVHLKDNPWRPYDAGAEMAAAFGQIRGFLKT